MSSALSSKLQEHYLQVLASPALWLLWPFLPLVRPCANGEEELGLLFDARAVCNFPSLQCTVFLANLFLLPPQLDQFLALPKETFDSYEAILAAGWRVD